MRLSEKTFSVGEDPYAGATDEALQRAVDDAVAAGGGRVELPEGVFEMHNSLRLRSGVSVRGRGEKTVLRKAPCVSSPIVDCLGYGHCEVTVEEPEKFRVGQGLTVRDETRHGFDVTVGTIRRIDGNRLFIDHMFTYDYSPAHGGRAMTIYPIVTAEFAENVSLRDIVLEGADDDEVMGGCRGGGVFLIQTHTATIERVEVREYNGDGVSFQQCTDIVVRDCHIHHMAENGLHPGSGSVRYLLQGNLVEDCGGTGLFYCLRTTHSLCEGNRILRSGRAGISIGERDTDHIIRGNEVAAGAWAAVHFRDVHVHGGDRVLLENNVFEANCREQAQAEVVVAEGIEDVVFRGNRFVSPGAPPVSVGKGAGGICIAPGNSVDGRPLAAPDVVGEGEVRGGEPERELHVGPGAAMPDEARHLGRDLSKCPANFNI